MKEFNVYPVTRTDAAEITAYVSRCRKLLFPMLDHRKVPADLLFFEETYTNNGTAAFLQARTHNGELAGVIGMLPYDGRFPQLSVTRKHTVEVVRLFVEPPYRRYGLGTLLFEELKKTAAQRNIQRFYLHTHPFLNGALEFWARQGFGLTDFREESGFPTYHMELNTQQEQPKKNKKDSLHCHEK